MPGFVYILKDEKGKFYIGSTSDMKRRIVAHKAGHTRTTHRMKNPNLVLVQEYETLEYARGVERKLKRLKRKDYIEKIVKEGYIRMALD